MLNHIIYFVNLNKQDASAAIEEEQAESKTTLGPRKSNK